MKKIAVLGGGISGYGSAILAKKKGFDVFLSDAGRIADRYKAKLDEWQVPYEEGAHTEERILDAAEVVKSPGIPETAPLVRKLRAAGIPVISEIEFAGRYTGRAKCICITGSNGKTTTTSLIYKIMRDAGMRVALGGNIGESFAYSVATGDYDWYVLELSSFQLDGMHKFRAHIGVLMNITPDHLDRYDHCFQNYADSKMRITQNQTSRDYFVYSGDDEVRSLLPDGEELVPVSALAAREMPVRTEVIEHRLPDGSIALREIPAPSWIEPQAAGQTPMCEALRRVRDIAAEWTARAANAESFPPVVFNITDGEATDCDDEELRAVCNQIKALETADGNVLLINIHIAAGDAGRHVFFPEAHEANYTNRYAALLYDCSSEMPAVFNEAIREAKGPGAVPPFRGMSYNASAAQLVTMLNIGSISVKTE